MEHGSDLNQSTKKLTEKDEQEVLGLTSQYSSVDSQNSNVMKSEIPNLPKQISKKRPPEKKIIFVPHSLSGVKKKKVQTSSFNNKMMKNNLDISLVHEKISNVTPVETIFLQKKLSEKTTSLEEHFTDKFFVDEPCEPEATLHKQVVSSTSEDSGDSDNSGNSLSSPTASEERTTLYESNKTRTTAPKRCGDISCPELQYYSTLKEAEKHRFTFKKLKGSSTCCPCGSTIQYYVGGKWRRSGAVSLYYKNLENIEE
eukprot:gene4473-7854_t